MRGQEVKIGSPRDAIANGIGMVHQHFVLVDPFTVTENIILGEEGGERLDIVAAQQRIAELADSYGFRVRSRGGRGGAVGRRGAARRDPQGALPRRGDPHPGRADGGAHPQRDQGPVRQPPEAPRGRPDDRVHQPQAGRGDGDRRPHHGPSAREGGGRDPSGRDLEGQARRDDGGPSGAVPSREADGPDRGAGAAGPGPHRRREAERRELRGPRGGDPRASPASRATGSASWRSP